MSRGLGNKMKRNELETSKFSSKFPAKWGFDEYEKWIKSEFYTNSSIGAELMGSMR